MRVTKLRMALLPLGCMAIFALPAAAQPNPEPDYEWDHPCADDPENEQTCHPWNPNRCWCDGVWNNVDHWSSDPDGYPSESTDAALIHHSNTGYCSNGDPCSDNDDCTGDCDNYELWLELTLVNEETAELGIITKNTTATDDSLTIKFEGSGTLILDSLYIHGAAGPVELQMTGSAAIETE